MMSNTIPLWFTIPAAVSAVLWCACSLHAWNHRDPRVGWKTLILTPVIAGACWPVALPLAAGVFLLTLIGELKVEDFQPPESDGP